MQQQILNYFYEYQDFAFLLSLLLSVVISVLGIVPSVFLTGANLYFFGLWKGGMVSFLGEALGAVIAFSLYRKGFRKSTQGRIDKFPRLKKLIEANGREAFLLVLSLRLLPFIPSGFVTFAAAIGSVSWIIFVLASTLGKAPALLMEIYAVYQVTQFNWKGKFILSLVSIYLLYKVRKRIS